MTALSGKSGSGKTTLLNCLGLILPVDSGAVLVDNTDATRWHEAQRTAFWRKSASFIYQDYGIIGDESVSFNVSLRKIGSNDASDADDAGFMGVKLFVTCVICVILKFF